MLPLVVKRITCLFIPTLIQVAGNISVKKEGAMQATKLSDREIVLTRTFAAPPQVVFDALTQAKHIVNWMKPTNMSLETCEVDLRAGGSFRWAFQRPGGARIEVRGAYERVDPPRLFAYTETYDFSPLKILVTTVLAQVGRNTVFKQTLTYPSEKERDQDFDGVAASATEVYSRLERYLASAR